MSTRHSDPGMFTLVIGAVSFILGTACLLASGSGESKRVAAGNWGGMGIGLEVTEAGGRVEFDCAHGTIGEPLLLDAEGRFGAKGLFFREHGGPVREGENGGEPARYTGQVSGDTMTLTVKPEKSDAAIGSFQLVHGKTGRIHKCL